MKKRLWQLSALALILLIAGFVFWLNQDRLLGHIVLPKDSLAFAEQIKQIRAERKWSDATGYKPKLTRRILLESRQKGCSFLVNNQKPEGNFNYEYDFVAKKQASDDNQVRQAGALWGVVLCHQFEPTPATKAAIEKGLDFFFRNTDRGPRDTLAIYYPGQKTVATGTVALVSLAIIDYLRTSPELTPERVAELNAKLDGYLKFLKAMQFPAGDFSYGTTRGVSVRIGRSSPYFDGEAQLALTKAIKYLDRREYLPVEQKAAAMTAKKYTVDAWRKKQDSDLTKSFYQWSNMAFTEYWQANFENAATYADTVLALSWWMVHTHHILNRSRNTGYAYEGLAHAYHVAKTLGDAPAAAELAKVIDKGLYELTTWQVEGPLYQKNKYLRGHRTEDPLAVGGIMNASNKPGLRIDVTQHQMHAVILALKYLYTE